MTSSITSGTQLKNSIAWIHYALALLMAASLCIADALMLKVYFAWACTWVIDMIVDRRYLKVQFSWKKAAAYAFGLFYLLMLISLLYTDNTAYAGKQLIRRLAFLVTPCMAIFGFNSKYNIKQLLFAFVIGAMLALLYSVALPFVEYSMQTGERYLFQKNAYDQFVNIAMNFKHRSYFGVMQLMALASLAYLKNDLIQAWGRKSYRWIFVLYAGFLLLHLLFMKGRAPLLGMFALLLLIFFHQQKQHKKWAIVGLVVIVLSLLALWQWHPRFQNIQWKQLQSEQLHLNQKEERVGIWYSSLQLIFQDQHWLVGVGSGDIKDALNEQFEKDELKTSNMHTHNTLLNSWLELGLPGLLLTLFIILWPLLMVDKSQRWFVCALAIPLYLLMMVEAFTQPIHGILPWVMFVLLAAHIDQDNTNKAIGRLTHMNYVCYGIFSIMAVLWFSFIDMERAYDPRNPRSYAQNKHYNIVKDLPAPIPSDLEKCKGYRVAAGVESIYREHQHAADFINSLYLPNNTYKSFSAWCYVSEDFNGQSVKIQSFRVRDGKEIFANHEYDLSRKGSWQLLSIDVSEMDRYADCSFFIRQYGVENLDQLQGYVIFALPLFHK